MAENTREFSYPVWHAEGGGLVREVNGTYICIEKLHDSLNIDAGDVVPETINLWPANEKAVRAMQPEDDPDAYELAMEKYIHRGHQPTGRV